MNEDFKNFLLVWLAVVILVLTGFGLTKLSGIMFDTQPTSTLTDRQAKECWQHGGTPVLDTTGTDTDFKTCTYGKE